MPGESHVRSERLQIYLCTQRQCTRQVVHLKIYAGDVATRDLNGPGLAQALRELVVAKDLGEQVQVREASCMRGCLLGPRLNVVGAGGFKETVRYLHLPTAKRHVYCAPWEDVASVEDVLDRHIQIEERRKQR